MKLVSSNTLVRSLLISSGQVVLLSVIFFGLAVLAAVLRFGSLAAGVAYISGDQILIEYPDYRGYYDPTMPSITLKYVVYNFGNVDVRIIGSSSSCAC